MRAIVVVMIGIVLLASCTSAQRTLVQKDMRKDLNRLERSIKKTHPAISKTISDSSLTKIKSRISKEVPKQASVLEFAELVYPLIDTVQGGHIGIYPRGAMWRIAFQSQRHSLPLSLKQLDNAQTVIQALKQSQDSMLLGAIVLKINNRPINDLINEAYLFSGGSDGTNRSGARNRAIKKLPQHLRWTLGKQDEFNVLLRINGQDSLVTFFSDAAKEHDAQSSKQKEISRKKNKEKTINYGFDPGRSVAIIDLNSFSGYDPFNVIFPMTLKKVLAKAEQDSAQSIILDLRDNGGGRSSNIMRVLKHFVKEETEVFKPWTFPKTGWRYASLQNKLIFAPNVLFGKGDQKRFGRVMKHTVKPRKRGFGGSLIVLINSGTFSAATITASIFKSNGRATLMGQEAGGNYHETYAGLFSMITLRRTGLKVRMPHLLIPVAADESKQAFSKTLQPDIIIPLTIDDVLDPRDLELLQALEFGNK